MHRNNVNVNVNVGGGVIPRADSNSLAVIKLPVQADQNGVSIPTQTSSEAISTFRADNAGTPLEWNTRANFQRPSLHYQWRKVAKALFRTWS